MKLKLAFLLALISSAGLIAQAAGRAVMEATKAAVLKADASLESVYKAIEASRAKGKGDKGGKKPEGDKGGKKPEAK